MPNSENKTNFQKFDCQDLTSSANFSWFPMT